MKETDADIVSFVDRLLAGRGLHHRRWRRRRRRERATGADKNARRRLDGIVADELER